MQVVHFLNVAAELNEVDWAVACGNYFAPTITH